MRTDRVGNSDTGMIRVLRRVISAILVTLVLAPGRMVFGAQESRRVVRPFPEFKAHTVARLQGGYKVAAVDIDRDGKLDMTGYILRGLCDQKQLLSSWHHQYL